MPKSIKTNYLLTMIKNGSMLIFPLITFPYTSRILGPDGIGKVSFLSSLIAYVSLFVELGIPLYATKEVAEKKNNPILLTKTVMELLYLQFFMVIFGYGAVAVLIFCVPQVGADVLLFIILSTSVGLTAMGVDWFYTGMEDFLYITVRGLVVNIIAIALLFLLVKSREDILWYGFFSVFGAIGSNVCNFIRLRKFVHPRLVKFSQLKPFIHFKGILKTFLYIVIITIYVQINVVVLGFMEDQTSVGFYTTSYRIFLITLSLSGVLGTVVMPRLSNLWAQKKEDEFNQIAQKGYNFAIAFCIPLCIGLIFTSPCAILLLAGEKFHASIMTSVIIAPSIIAAALIGALGFILYPKGKVAIITICSLIGLTIDVLFCLLLIPKISHMGAGIAYTISEWVIAIALFILGRKYLSIKYFSRKNMNAVWGGVVMTVVLTGIYFLHLSNLATLILMVICGAGSYVGFLFLRNDELVTFLHLKEKLAGLTHKLLRR